MTRFRLFAAATAIAAATMIGTPQAGQAAPVEECTSVMTTTEGQGCTIDLAPGDHRISVDMVSTTGTFRFALRDSVGVIVYQVTCTVQPSHSECLPSFGHSDEARVNGGGGGIRSVSVVSHSFGDVSATLSHGGSAALEVGPGTGVVTLDAS